MSMIEQSAVLTDFEPTPSLAAKLLSPTLDPSPLEPEIEEKFWQICDYSWLSNLDRPTSKANTVSPSASEFSGPEAITIPRSGHTPDFEMLLAGALSLDYSFLDMRGYTNTIAASER